MKVAVIILNYNNSADCKKCIDDLLLQTGVEQEVIVVDNCSCNEQRAAAQEICNATCATFIANEKNSGYNAGNNVGLRYAAMKGYEYAMIANPDMQFPQRNYIATLLQPMIENHDIVVCGSDIVGLDGIHQSPMFRDGNWRSSFGWVKEVFCKKKKNDAYDFIDNYKESHLCHKVSGCCLAVKMQFMKEINFFDENVFLYCEEAILARQVENAGKKIFYTTKAQAIHAHKKSEKGNPVARFNHWKKSRCYYIDNYSGDTTFGKFMARLSIKLYIGIMITYIKIRQWRQN